MTSSPEIPDGRDVFDFADAVNAGKHPQPQNDLERTYLHVQQAMSGASLPTDMKEKSWEDIMATLAMPSEKPVSNRTKRLTAPPPPPVVARKRPQWASIASIAAVVAVILASFGIWQSLSGPGGPDSDAPYAPHLAALVPIDPSPMATQVYNLAYCTGMTENIPVTVVKADEAARNQNSLDVMVWLDDTTVRARCTDGTEIILAEGAVDISQSAHPGIVEYGFRDGSTYIRTYHSLMNGKTISDNWSLRTSLDTGEFGTSLANPLQVVISTRDQSQWSVADFDTMEEATLEELTGVRISSSQRLTATGSEDGSTIAIAPSMYETEGSSTFLRIYGAPGDVAIISANFLSSSWISIPEEMAQVNNISLSSDGTQLTFTWNPSFSGGAGEVQYVVVDVATGEVVAG